MDHDDDFYEMDSSNTDSNDDFAEPLFPPVPLDAIKVALCIHD